VHVIGHGSEQTLVAPDARASHKPVDPPGKLVLCLVHVLTRWLGEAAL
jgi:hypothetical protein